MPRHIMPCHATPHPATRQGTLAASLLAFILPGMCHMKLADGRILSRKKMPSLLLAVFGFTVMTVGTGFALLGLIQGDTTADVCFDGGAVPVVPANHTHTPNATQR